MRAVARVAGVSDMRIALIGGVAVACRLGAAHRATQDADLVADPEAPGSSAAVLVADRLGAVRAADDRVVVDGTKVEIIDTDALDSTALHELDRLDHLFVAAHRWALESAEPLDIAVQGDTAAARLPVATSGALVAAKLHPLLGRRRAQHKRASDVYDLVQLLEAHFGDIADAVAGAPYGLPDLVANGVGRVLVDEADQAVRLMRAHGEPAWARRRPEELAVLGRRFVERLTGDA